MLFSQLLNALPVAQIVRAGNPEIRGLAYDSRKVAPGTLFVAVPGFHTDGHRYVGAALDQGTAAIIAQDPAALRDRPGEAALVAVPDSRLALALVAAEFYGQPSRRLCTIGITGTDGKTTSSFLVRSVLAAAGRTPALLGTVLFQIGERIWDNESRQTTPEAPEIQEFLAEAVRAGADCAVVESTSHALALHRVAGIAYDVGLFTNLSPEHLDFHETVEQYRADKGKLFERLGEGPDKGYPRRAVLNADDPASDYFRSVTRVPVLTYARQGPADVRPRDLVVDAGGCAFVAETPVGPIPVAARLPGDFNVHNCLGTVAVGVALGLPAEAISQGLAAVSGVPGRMERIDEGQPFTVIVDYAHTPESLSKVLSNLRPLTGGRLGAVFGSAGERDRLKRPAMGAIAARQADFFVLANEDPRLEDEHAILAEIAAGAVEAGAREGREFWRIADRREAIRHAFQQAGPGDLLLLAGKGHEGSIIVGTTKTPWDERRVARELLRELGYRGGGRT